MLYQTLCGCTLPRPVYGGASCRVLERRSRRQRSCELMGVAGKAVPWCEFAWDSSRHIVGVTGEWRNCGKLTASLPPWELQVYIELATFPPSCSCGFLFGTFYRVHNIYWAPPWLHDTALCHAGKRRPYRLACSITGGVYIYIGLVPKESYCKQRSVFAGRRVRVRIQSPSLNTYD